MDRGAVRETVLQLFEEYANEAEYQDGTSYWCEFDGVDDALEDFILYMAHEQVLTNITTLKACIPITLRTRYLLLSVFEDTREVLKARLIEKMEELTTEADRVRTKPYEPIEGLEQIEKDVRGMVNLYECIAHLEARLNNK